jgi:hypothetical protein
MKYLFSALLVITLIWGCKNDKKPSALTEEKKISKDSTLITDSSWGIIDRLAGIETLKKIFGDANVKDERICGPECVDSVDVTKIYSEKDKEIIIYWQDSAYHKKIGFLENYQQNSPYHTSAGIKMGSTLIDLLKLNGNKITFSGFGWDYGGFIQSFNKGALERSNINYHLDIKSEGDISLSGDTELNTDMPEVKKMLGKIAVSYISLSFTKAD